MAKDKTERTKETEVIRVRGDVYDRIAEMAGPEERSLGGQVAILTKMACAHPQENREKRYLLISPVPEFGKKSKDNLVLGFFCTKCGMLVVNPTNSADVMTSALSTVEATKQWDARAELPRVDITHRSTRCIGSWRSASGIASRSKRWSMTKKYKLPIGCNA